MGLKCGIVGLPNVGKSTLFNALTSAGALAANYPFATKDPNIGMITVPDPRLHKLAELVKTKKVVETTVEVVDIAGLIKGASQGEGLGNQFLANIREVDAVLHVIRCFDDGNVVHVDGSVDPVRDKEVIDMELILKDMEIMAKRVDRLSKLAKSGKREEVQAFEFGKAVLKHLESEKRAQSFEIDETRRWMLDELQLLTAKPVLYVCNVDESSAGSGNAYVEAFRASVASENAEILVVSAAIEAEIAELDSEEVRFEFAREMGLSEPGAHRVIHSAYHLLDLITYFTAGEKETRAWTITRGTKAPGAAGVIHSDFEKGFIRAEVIKYDDFVSAGSEAAVKQIGKMAIEGKEYVVKDGDVMHFLFNV
jgi:GTP-binding protein YchF